MKKSYIFLLSILVSLIILNLPRSVFAAKLLLDDYNNTNTASSYADYGLNQELGIRQTGSMAPMTYGYVNVDTQVVPGYVQVNGSGGPWQLALLMDTGRADNPETTGVEGSSMIPGISGPDLPRNFTLSVDVDPVVGEHTSNTWAYITIRSNHRTTQGWPLNSGYNILMYSNGGYAVYHGGVTLFTGSVTAADWYNIKVGIQNNLATLTINGQTQTTVVDVSGYSDNGFTLGSYGGWTNGDYTVTLYDNLTISGLAGPDFNDDGSVDFYDLTTLADDWLKIGVLTADITNDNVVNFADFTTFASHWLEDKGVKINNFLGELHVYDNAGQVLPSAKEAGMRWVHGAINWYLSQPTSDDPNSDTWDWAPTTFIDIYGAGQYGMNVELVVGGTPPPWSNSLTIQEKWEKWAYYCQQVALKFDGSDSVSNPLVSAFTIQSEFNCTPYGGNVTCDYWWEWFPAGYYSDIPHLYADMYTVARRAIKEVRPDVPVMIAGPSGTGIDWLTQVFDLLDPNDYPEFVNCHPFMYPSPEQVYQGGTFLGKLEAVHEQVIKRYYGVDSSVKIWLGECGGYTTVACSEEEQARYAMREIILAISTQYVQQYAWAMIWHDFDDPAWVNRPDDWWGHTGVVKGGTYWNRTTWTLKPIYSVVQKMHEVLTDATYIGRRSTGINDYAFEFRRPDGKLLTVAWTTPTSSYLDFSIADNPQAYTWLWASKSMSTVGNYKRVSLSGQPCYIVSGGN